MDAPYHPVVARDDGNGNVWCLLCGWSDRGYSREQLEFLVNRHLTQAHGGPLTHRSDFQGNVYEVPH